MLIYFLQYGALAPFVATSLRFALLVLPRLRG
jgi:hypothetical protein